MSLVRARVDEEAALGVTSLLDICVAKLIQQRQNLGDLGYLPAELLRSVLHTCTRQELQTIEDETLAGGRDLTWLTWDLWWPIFRAAYGSPRPGEAEQHALPQPPPGDYVTPSGNLAPPADYRAMLEAREAAMAARRSAVVHRLRASYATERDTRLQGGVEFTTKLPPPKRRRLDTPAVQQAAARAAALPAKLGGKPASKVLRDLGLAGSSGGGGGKRSGGSFGSGRVAGVRSHGTGSLNGSSSQARLGAVSRPPQQLNSNSRALQAAGSLVAAPGAAPGAAAGRGAQRPKVALLSPTAAAAAAAAGARTVASRGGAAAANSRPAAGAAASSQRRSAPAGGSTSAAGAGRAGSTQQQQQQQGTLAAGGGSRQQQQGTLAAAARSPSPAAAAAAAGKGGGVAGRVGGSQQQQGLQQQQLAQALRQRQQQQQQQQQQRQQGGLLLDRPITLSGGGGSR